MGTNFELLWPIDVWYQGLDLISPMKCDLASRNDLWFKITPVLRAVWQVSYPILVSPISRALVTFRPRAAALQVSNVP